MIIRSGNQKAVFRPDVRVSGRTFVASIKKTALRTSPQGGCSVYIQPLAGQVLVNNGPLSALAQNEDWLPSQEASAQRAGRLLVHAGCKLAVIHPVVRIQLLPVDAAGKGTDRAVGKREVNPGVVIGGKAN